MQTKEAWQSRANRAGMGRRVQSKRSCRRRQSRRLCIWQFASMRAAQVYGYWQIWCRRGASWCICHGSMSNALQFCRPTIVFVSLLARCNLLGALGASAGRRRRVVGDVVCTLRCQSLAAAKCRGSEQVPTACCCRCMGREGLCRIFGGICALPLGAPSEARYIYSSLIGKPRRFEWCPEPAGLRSGHCAMYHTRRSFHCALRSGP